MTIRRMRAGPGVNQRKTRVSPHAGAPDPGLNLKPPCVLGVKRGWYPRARGQVWHMGLTQSYHVAKQISAADPWLRGRRPEEGAIIAPNGVSTLPLHTTLRTIEGARQVETKHAAHACGPPGETT